MYRVLQTAKISTGAVYLLQFAGKDIPGMETGMQNKIAETISQVRQNRKMTQEEFASRLGVTPQAVSRWERGAGLPDISLIAGICEILQISANDLLGIQAGRVVEDNDPVMTREIKNNLIAEPLLLEFAAELVPYVGEGLKTDYVNRRREELAREYGILLPLLRIRDNVNLQPCEVRIMVYNQVMFDKVYDTLPDTIYFEIINEVITVCKEHYGRILNKNLVKIMVDNVKRLYPGAADGLVPDKLSYLQLLEALRKEYEEKQNIHDLLGILERAEAAMEQR